MNVKLQQKIFNDFPRLFKRNGIRASPIDLGIDCENGWYKLIYELCQDLTRYLDNLPKQTFIDNIKVEQIKEKFGTLRFYVSHYDDYTRERIQKAESQSWITCEICGGKKATLTVRGGYYQTLCRKCRLKKGSNLIKKKISKNVAWVSGK